MTRAKQVRRRSWPNAPHSKAEDGFAAHTPGPWTAGKYSSVVGVPITAQPDKTKNTVVIAGTMAVSGANHRAESEANARVFAAGPDMLAALHEVEGFLDNQADVEDGDYGEPRPNRAMRLLTEVRAAIAKATSEPPNEFERAAGR